MKINTKKTKIRRRRKKKVKGRIRREVKINTKRTINESERNTNTRRIRRKINRVPQERKEA